MAIYENRINDFNVLSAPTPPTSSTSTGYRSPHTMSRVQSNKSAAAHRRVRQIRRPSLSLICNASTVLRELAANQISMQAEQVEIHADSQAMVNSTNITALSFNLCLEDLELTLVRMTHNVHPMLRRLNYWKNEVNLNAFSDRLLDFRAATVDVVRNAAYLGHCGNYSDGDFNVLLVIFFGIVPW